MNLNNLQQQILENLQTSIRKQEESKMLNFVADNNIIPIPYPNDGNAYQWDENLRNWTLYG